MNDLSVAIQQARAKGVGASVALAAAKKKMKDAIVQSIKSGEDSFTFQAPALSPDAIKDFERWMRDAGVSCERVHDPRDGDYYQVKGLRQ